MSSADKVQIVPVYKKCLGWAIHALTASGAFFGLMALVAIYEQEYLSAFWLMFMTTFIDAIDGCLARCVNVKVVAPQIDGALLDNIVDFFTYTILPCFFLLVSSVLPEHWRVLGVLSITFSSAYQFCQVDAKTHDHFFKGFPSYWNIAVFYLFFWQMNPWTNFFIIMVLSILSFVPIKYIYPSRLDYLTDNKFLRLAMLLATVVWAMATAGLLFVYPASNHFLVFLSMGYLILYVVLSVYRTYYPLKSIG